jgi:dipeptidyl aminopeptidase/acylaminoacyl peptidase
MTTSTADLARFHAWQRFGEQVKGGRWLPMWRSDGRGFCVVDGAPERTVILDVNPDTGAATPFVDPARVRKALESAVGASLPWDGLPFQQFRLIDGDRGIEFSYADRWFRLDTSSYDIAELTPVEQDRRRLQAPREVGKTFLGPRQPIHEVPAPSGEVLLGMRDGNLYLRSVLDDREAPLTSEADADVRWTVEDARWSFDGRYVVAVRTDSRGIDRFPILHWLTPVSEVESVPYTKTGGRASTRTMCVIDTRSHQVTEFDLGRPGDDLFVLIPLMFLPDGDFAFLVSDRRNKVLELRRADVRTGSSSLIVEERQDTFVYGINFGSFGTSFTPLPDAEHFVWMSERDGWRHAYLHRLDGTLVRRLTHGEFEVDRVAGVDVGSGRLWLVARADTSRPYDQHLCTVGLDGSSFRQVTTDAGVHFPMVSPSGTTVVDIHSSVSRPPRTDLLRADGSLVKTLATAEISALGELGFEPPEEFTVTALDGKTTLHGRLYRPTGFDASRRYPCVEYIYGGPQLALHPNDFTSESLSRLFAQLGFVSFVVDGPGTPGRGKAFQDAVAGRFGQFEIEEHANVVRQLGERYTFLDTGRVGILGGSWGGYNTVRALLRAPDTYHVGVAIYPVADCLDQFGMAIEPYLGLPQDDPLAYAAGSTLPLVDALRGKLYLVHGSSDVNAPLSATMKLVDAFMRASKPFDLLVVPEMDHSMAGWRGQYILDRAAEYLIEHLGGPR